MPALAMVAAALSADELRQRYEAARRTREHALLTELASLYTDARTPEKKARKALLIARSTPLMGSVGAFQGCAQHWLEEVDSSVLHEAHDYYVTKVSALRAKQQNGTATGPDLRELFNLERQVRAIELVLSDHAIGDAETALESARSLADDAYSARVNPATIESALAAVTSAQETLHDARQARRIA